MLEPPRSILVTGAASGIGLAVADHFARSGCTVVAIDRDREGLRRLRQGVPGARLHLVECDLADRAPARRAFGEAAALGYQAAVNCAGVEGRTLPLAEQDADDIDRAVDVNVKATLHCLREELRHLLPRAAGAIVNVSSIYGLRGQPGWVAYSAGKAAVLGMTRGAALEAAAAGVRVNAVAPGPIETPLLARSTGGDYARTAAMVPMKRNGRPAEVVAAIAWLLSDAAAFVTGAVLAVDGGMSAQVVAQAAAPSRLGGGAHD